MPLNLRNLVTILVIRMMHKKQWFLLIKLIPCLLVVIFVVHKINPTSLDEKLNEDYEYLQNDGLTSSLSSSPSPLSSLPLSSSSTFNPLALRALINSSNSLEFIFNQVNYGPLATNEPVIIIQVHDRVEYLKYLIKSLQEVKGIEKSLIIFTHDVYSPLINNVVQSIRFCKVMQIFYPFSLQAYPNEFPGTDPKDCPRDIKQQEAIRIGCQNADHPDSYEHYREASYTQTKHHWFWKINTIFDKLNVTKNHDGPFIFLEEDHFAAPDMLHVERLMEDFHKSQNLNVDLLSLGGYPKVVNFINNGDKLELQVWSSSQHNMGMVLRRQTWNKIRRCSKQFCTYDDYNWDWSLQHISQKCLQTPLKTLSLIAPRVFHIGECGVHHKKVNCSKNQVLFKVRQNLRASVKYLFPSQLKIQKTTRVTVKKVKPNGGWGDIRDHILCLQKVINPETMEAF